MKRKGGIWFILFIVLFFSGRLNAEEENIDEIEGIEAEESVAVCDNLKEEMGFMIEVNNKLSSEFKIVSDKELCASVSEQCEYFYLQARQTQKEYRKSCDPDYEIAKVEKCDYSENPCIKNRFRTRSGFYAGTSSSVKDNPFDVKILTLFTGE